MAVTIEKLADGLRRLTDAEFTCDGVYRFLAEHPVDVNSISQYLHWSDKFYTRNLIYKDARFEMMAICWNKGQTFILVGRFNDIG